VKVAVFGMGYVGSVTAACLAEHGHVVTGVDPDRHKLLAIETGAAPVNEPGLDRLVATGRTSGHLHVTTEAEDALDRSELSLVCVGTPSRPNGTLDTRHVLRVCEQVGSWLAGTDRFYSVVVRSTVLPGSVDLELLPALESASGKRAGRDFGVAFCPEFLRESTAVADFYDPPFTVCGATDERTMEAVRTLFGFLRRPFHAVPVATAEAVKYACNAFHAVKITFANEVARFASAVGIDARDVMQLVREDTRLNVSPAYLHPGFAFGGSCLPKDLRALVHQARLADRDLPMLASVLPSNDQQVAIAARHVLDSGARTVGLLGLSFKAGTDDLRESPYVELAETLIGKGVDLRIHDPDVRTDRVFGSNRTYMEEHLPHLGRILCDDPREALADAEGAVVGEVDAATAAEVVRANPPFVLDLCGRLAAEVEALPGYQGLAW